MGCSGMAQKLSVLAGMRLWLWLACMFFYSCTQHAHAGPLPAATKAALACLACSCPEPTLGPAAQATAKPRLMQPSLTLRRCTLRWRLAGRRMKARRAACTALAQVGCRSGGPAGYFRARLPAAGMGEIGGGHSTSMVPSLVLVLCTALAGAGGGLLYSADESEEGEEEGDGGPRALVSGCWAVCGALDAPGWPLPR